MALSYLSSMSPLPGSCDPQWELTDSLMGFICDQLDNPEIDIGALLNPEPNPEPRTQDIANPLPLLLPQPPPILTTQHNANPQPPLPPSPPPVPTTQHNENFQPLLLPPPLQVMTTQQNANPQPLPPPLPVPTLSSSPIANHHIQSLHQDLYCTNAQNSCYTSAEFSSSAVLKYHQTCNNHFSAASLTNQVNVIYRNPGFPVRPCTGTVQGMLVPAVECATAQSVAARVRRKKISEKTQELAKLIPGGTRMNTAEMLLASFKYVKFLQAQVGFLAMMDSKEAREVPLSVEEYMRVLLGSTNMQGYLSANGKCLVPKKLAMNLSKEMKSNVVVSRDLNRFVESLGR